MSIQSGATTSESLNYPTPSQNEQMSNQKYKRTNFDEEENSGIDATSRREMPSPVSNFDPTVSFQKYKLNFWRRRTFLEKLFIIVFIFLILIIIILSIIIGTRGKVYPEEDTSEICMKKSCVNVASSILNSIDTSVNPCHDFYHFACGNWIKSNSIPHGYKAWDTFQEVRMENYHVLREVVETPLNVSRNEAERKIKTLYWTCMDEGEYKEKKDISPLYPLVKAVGGWTISTIGGVRFNESVPWDFQDLLLRSFRLFHNVIFAMDVSENDRNPSTNMIKISQDSLMDKEMFENQTEQNIKKIQALKDYMLELALLMGGEKEESKMYLEEVFEFLTALVKMTDTPEEMREDMMNFNVMNVSEIQQAYPFINWLDFLNNFFSFSNITVNESEAINVGTQKYFEKLTPFINETLRTANGRRTIQNFVLWGLVQTFSPLLSKRFRDAKARYIKIMWGIVGEEDQWKACLTNVENLMGFGLGAMFVRERFKPESKISATQMISNIKRAFIANLPSLSWMDDHTRAAAIEKANAMLYQIGYPDFILNNTLLDAFVQEYDIREHEYFENCFRIYGSIHKIQYSKLRTLNDKFHWSMTPSTVNAYYSPTKNLMAFPAGILQGKFFNKDLPDSINYGSIGVVVGHELTHGFDDQGSKYDLNGVYRKWWVDQIRDSFHNRTQCLVDQYNNYQVDGKHLNGKFTLGENIADNGGLKSSYYAYIGLKKKEQKLPGVHYSHKQLFFISFAQGWCSKQNRVDLERNLINDVHSISQFRVIGSASNFQEFSNVFQCPSGSPMSPPEKCEVW